MHPTNDGSKQNHDRIKSIGKYTYGTNNINIYYWGEGTYLEIGNFCSISGHVLIYLGGNQFIHASGKKYGVIISEFIGTPYQNTFKGAGRPKSMIE